MEVRAANCTTWFRQLAEKKFVKMIKMFSLPFLFTENRLQNIFTPWISENTALPRDLVETSARSTIFHD